MVLPHWQGSTHQVRQDHEQALASSPSQHRPPADHLVRGHSDLDLEVKRLAKGRSITWNPLGCFFCRRLCRRLPTSGLDLSRRYSIPVRIMAYRSHRSNNINTRSPSPWNTVPLCNGSWFFVPWNLPIPVNTNRDRTGPCKKSARSDRLSDNYHRNTCNRRLSATVQPELLQHPLIHNAL